MDCTSGRGYDRYPSADCSSGRGHDRYPGVDCTSRRGYDRYPSVVPLRAATTVTPAKIRRLRRAVIVETDWVRISTASTDIDDTGRGVYEQHSDDQGRLLFVVEDLRLFSVYEFRVRVRLLFHPFAPPGWSELFESEMYRTLSEVSDPAPPVEAEVPDLPPPLFLTNGTLLLSFPWLMRDPHVIRCPRPTIGYTLVLDSEWYDIQSGPFDGNRSFVVSNERLASLQEGVVFRLWRCLPGPGKGMEDSHHLLRTEGRVGV